MWIAYNFLSLQGSLQSSDKNGLSLQGCELLTIFYLYKVLCSPLPYSFNLSQVVNCLQFFIFTRFFAVSDCRNCKSKRLWIAYNFLSLQGSLQFKKYGFRCGLVVNCLQFFIFTRFFAVNGVYFLFTPIVVNCLQFFIFTRFFAVAIHCRANLDLLWIAYNFLSLQGSLQ